MAYYPNGWQSTICRGRPIGGAAPAYSVTGGWYGERFNRYVSATWSRMFGGFPSATYFPVAAIPPRTPGAIASQSGARSVATVSPLTVVTGRNLTGNIACLFTVADANLGLVVNLDGTITCTCTVDPATLSAGIFGEGSTTCTCTVDAATLGALAGIFAGPVTCTATADGTLTALGHMAGEVTPFTELSPENLARAVWQALATDYNEAGTMGNKLNTASSGGVDLNALAAAVLAAAQAAPIHANIKKVADTTVAGVGSSGDPWRPA